MPLDPLALGAQVLYQGLTHQMDDASKVRRGGRKSMKKNNNNITSLAVIAIVAALGVLGVVIVVAVTTLPTMQEAEARGCVFNPGAGGILGVNASKGRCIHG
jgi:hypothetical protein